jgi:hypothetical protein
VERFYVLPVLFEEGYEEVYACEGERGWWLGLVWFRRQRLRRGGEGREGNRWYRWGKNGVRKKRRDEMKKGGVVGLVWFRALEE